MRSLFDTTDRASVERRLESLTPDAHRRWGRMTAHQAVCHLNDSFKGILGDRPVPKRPVGLKTKVVRFLGFTSPIPWPKGVPTAPEQDAEKGGTRPADFADDVRELQQLIDRFVQTRGELEPHYKWGDMSRAMWGRYGYRHVDHHLRQFGV